MITTHKKNGATFLPLCCVGAPEEAHILSDDVDMIDCVACLRLLLKDAVLYGRDRKAKRQR